MTLVLIEGFDHMTDAEVAQVEQKGWINGNPFGDFAVPAAEIIAGRPTAAPNSRAVRLSHNLSSPLYKLLPATYATAVCGFAVNPYNGGDHFFELQTAALGTVCKVGLTNGNRIYVTDAAGATTTTGSTYIVAGQWTYIEVKVTVGSSGSVEVHLNGVVEISATSGDFGSADIGAIAFFTDSNLAQNAFDDVYVCDTSGTANNDFLGDSHVETLYPNADGTYSQWSPLSGSSHYPMVDEPQADGDTSYVYDKTAGDKDSYALDTLSITSGTVFGCQLNLYGRKNEAGTRQIKALVRQGGSDYLSGAYTLTTDYIFFSWLLDADPTGSGWTIANVNGDEYGVELAV